MLPSVFSLFVAAVFTVCLLCPGSLAFADYRISTVDITAQMQTNNSLNVVSQRTYESISDYSLLRIPLSQSYGSSSVKIESVRLIEIVDGKASGEWSSLDDAVFQTSWRGLYDATGGIASQVDARAEQARSESAGGESTSGYFTLPKTDSWSYDARNSNLYVFLNSTQDDIVLEINYIIEDATVVYQDIAELDWQYIPSSQDASTDDVNLHIALPVPEGVSVVPGDNVYAWGHGPYGTLDIDSDGTIDYDVLAVMAGEYAQAHVIFPAKWLTHMDASDVVNAFRKDYAVSEEASWTDKTAVARINNLVIEIVQLAICFIALAVSVVVLLVRLKADSVSDESAAAVESSNAYKTKDADNSSGASKQSQSDRSDIRAGITPAIEARARRKNQWNGMDFCATLVALADKEVITIDSAGAATRFRIAAGAKEHDLSRLERLTLRFVFDTVGNEYESVGIQEIIEFCRKDAETARRALQEWQKQLDSDVRKAGIFDRRSRNDVMRLAVLSIAMALIGAIEWIWIQNFFPSIVWIGTGAAIGVIAYFMPRLSAFGRQVAEGGETQRKYTGDEDAEAEPASEGSVQEDAAGEDSWMDLLTAALDKATFSDEQ